ncbi:unnamed protein product [Oppiella nova]|uniref:Uncharacterized protein n=1 Tax=Oppiella nova TaxID=334625 RepID=A0A7R9LE78_9ACAR|nr:unnamed protein product [Oppiella nova]CAG2162053.1 unnamed protein product [Oppiella nova]
MLRKGGLNHRNQYVIQYVFSREDLFPHKRKDYIFDSIYCQFVEIKAIENDLKKLEDSNLIVNTLSLILSAGFTESSEFLFGFNAKALKPSHMKAIQTWNRIGIFGESSSNHVLSL